VPENLLQLPSLKMRPRPEHALAIKTTIRDENMEVGIESQEIAEALNGDNSPWNCSLFILDITQLIHRALSKQNYFPAL